MSVWLGITVVILSFASIVLVTLLSRKTTTDAFHTLNRIHARQSEQLDKALDRLMTIDWEKYAALQSLEESDEGGFIPPGGLTEDEDEPTKESWGALRRLQYRDPEEQALLDEDFPEEGVR